MKTLAAAREKARVRMAERRAKNPEKERRINREWREKNPEKAKQHGKKWRAKNQESRREYWRQYRQKHREEIRRRWRAWRFKNKNEVNRKARERVKKNPVARRAMLMRTRIHNLLSGHRKSAKTIELLGCPVESFWMYLESKFEPGMTRENYGTVWHIDHIMPVAIFDLSRPEHQRRCCHFSNLQPLFKDENWRKGKKVVTDQFNLL